MTQTGQTRFRGSVWDKRLYVGMYVFYAALFSGAVINPGKGGLGLRIAVAALISGMLWLGWRGRRLGAGDHERLRHLRPWLRAVAEMALARP